jgi:hypothetical protein
MTMKEAWTEAMMVLSDHDHKGIKRNSDGSKQPQPWRKEEQY